MIVVYTSSHGWGHNVRTVALLNELWNYPLEVVTTAPDWLIRTSLHNKRSKPLTIRKLLTDPGCVQNDPFNIDIDKSAEAWEKVFENLDNVLETEVNYLKTRGRIRLILSDISFFGQLVAEKLGVPSVCVATFDWAFIYHNYLKSYPRLAEMIQKVQDISARYDYCLIPGTACRPLSIGKQQIEFNWGSRKPRVSRPDIREMLGLTLVLDSVLLSFGGFPIRNLPQIAWKRFSNFEFFVLLPKKECSETPPAPNVHFLPSEDWSGMHIDLVNTVDVVMGKVGYGLCSECLHCEKPFLAVHREENPEEEVIKKHLKRTIPFREITQEQFKNGEWYLLNELVEMRVNELDYQKCVVDGEKQMAFWIRKILGDKEPIRINSTMVAGVILILAVLIWFIFKIVK